MKPIYLDNAATTRPDQGALAKAGEFLTERYFNPSALYGGGFAVRAALQTAREKLLSYIADPLSFDLIFTSCGTEADNHAIFCGAKRGNAVTTAGEHAAVYASFTELKNRGVEPRFAPLNSDGSVSAEEIVKLVDDRTSLVSVVHVNNETGAVNDIAEIARLVKKKNPRTLVHSDGVQAYGKIPVRLSKEIDLYSVSAHKIGGIKGAGALVKNKTVRSLSPFVYGGGQENGLRSGTENVFGIMSFYFAAERKFSALDADALRLQRCREKLWDLLNKQVFTRISPQNGTPYIITVSAQGLRGEVLQRMAEERGVIIGTGSACSSKHRFSRVMTACGFPSDVLDGVLRISFSQNTEESEAEIAANVLNECAARLKEKVK